MWSPRRKTLERKEIERSISVSEEREWIIGVSESMSHKDIQ